MSERRVEMIAAATYSKMHRTDALRRGSLNNDSPRGVVSSSNVYNDHKKSVTSRSFVYLSTSKTHRELTAVFGELKLKPLKEIEGALEVDDDSDEVSVTDYFSNVDEWHVSSGNETTHAQPFLVHFVEIVCVSFEIKVDVHDTHRTRLGDLDQPDGVLVRCDRGLTPVNVVIILEFKPKRTCSITFSDGEKGEIMSYLQKQRHIFESQGFPSDYIQQRQFWGVLCDASKYSTWRYYYDNNDGTWKFDEVCGSLISAEERVGFVEFIKRAVETVAASERDFPTLGSACSPRLDDKYIVYAPMTPGSTSRVFRIHKKAAGEGDTDEIFVMKVARDGDCDALIAREASVWKVIQEFVESEQFPGDQTGSFFFPKVAWTGTVTCGDDVKKQERNAILFASYGHRLRRSDMDRGLRLTHNDVTQLMLSLFVFHSSGYVHRDVDLRNIVRLAHGNMSPPPLFLIDAGYAQESGVANDVFAGTIATASDEVLGELDSSKNCKVAVHPVDDIVSLFRSMLRLHLPAGLAYPEDISVGKDKAARFRAKVKHSIALWKKVRKDYPLVKQAEDEIKTFMGAPLQWSNYEKIALIISKTLLLDLNNADQNSRIATKTPSPEKIQPQSDASKAASVPSAVASSDVMPPSPSTLKVARRNKPRGSGVWNDKQ